MFTTQVPYPLETNPLHPMNRPHRHSDSREAPTSAFRVRNQSSSMGCVVGKVALRQVYLRVTLPVKFIPPILHFHVTFTYHRRHVILATESVVKKNNSVVKQNTFPPPFPPSTPQTRRLKGCQSQSGRRGEQKNLSYLPGFETPPTSLIAAQLNQTKAAESLLRGLVTSLHSNPLQAGYHLHNSPPLDCVLDQRRRYVSEFTFTFHPIRISCYRYNEG